MTRTFLATLAVAALGLSACGGAADVDAPAPTTVESTSAAPAPEGTEQEATSAPAEETTTAVEPAPAEADFPFEEGPVEPAALVDAYAPAMQAVKTMTMTQTSGQVESVTVVDNSDPDHQRAYGVVESGDGKIESLVEGDVVYTRTLGGDWQQQDIPAGLGGVADAKDPEVLKQVIRSAVLVDKAARQFDVEMDIGLLMGQESSEETMPSTIWLDERNRVIKQEDTVMGQTSVTEFSGFDEPVDIPTRG